MCNNYGAFQYLILLKINCLVILCSQHSTSEEDLSSPATVPQTPHFTGDLNQTGFCTWSAKYFANSLMRVTTAYMYNMYFLKLFVIIMKTVIIFYFACCYSNQRTVIQLVRATSSVSIGSCAITRFEKTGSD